MMKLPLASTGARTLVTVVTSGAWLAMFSWQNGYVILSVSILAATFLFFLPLGAWLAPKINNGLPPRIQTVLEFVLYSGFISLITIQSVASTASGQFWYSIPTSFTIGIIPQVQSSLNRFYCILISLAIYTIVLQVWADISYFIDKDIHLYYLVVVASAFAVDSTGVVLGSIYWVFGKIKSAAEAVRIAVERLTGGGAE